MNPSIQTCMHACIHLIMQSRLNNTGQKITRSPTYNHDQWDDGRCLQNHKTMELTVASFSDSISTLARQTPPYKVCFSFILLATIPLHLLG
jgi:hypothetical protein